MPRNSYPRSPARAVRICLSRLARWLAGPVVVVVIATIHPALALEPKQVVERFQDVLLDTMKQANQLGVDGRYKRLRPEVEKAFDMTRMIRVASGPAWAEAADGKRDALVDAFTRMSTSTYASQFNGYSGESFIIDGVRDGPRDSRLVATQIVKSNGEKVPITYVMVADNGDWRIGDVLLDNSVSELAVRRSEYAAILRRDGVDALIKTLNQKADGLMTGN